MSTSKRTGFAGGNRQAKRKAARGAQTTAPNGKRKPRTKKVAAQTNALAKIMTPQQQGRDARRQVNLAQHPDLANQQHAIPIEVALPAFSLNGIMIAFVTKALERGFMANASTVDVPYFAMCYGLSILSTYVTGGIIKAASVPYWMLCLGQAIAPKAVPFQQGKVSYKFILDDSTLVPMQSFILGYNPYGYQWNVNVPTETLVNGFPLSAHGLAFDPDAGAQAFQELCQFMAKNAGDPASSKVSQLVPIGTTTRYAKDVSPFAVVFQPEGLGHAGVGGFSGLAELEVPIFHSVMALLAPPGNIPAVTSSRFYNFSTAVAGDSLYLGNALCSQYPEKTWSQRRYPRFHAVDFLEFGDVLGQWVSSIVQAYFNDPETVVAVATEEIARRTTGRVMNTADVICPLTLQEVLLLLRNVIMCAFKDTQTGAQDLYPRLPESGLDNQFVPYISSATTCPIAVLDMHLPIGMIENIRALVSRYVVMGKDHDVQWYVPVLGQYAMDTLSADNYTATDPVTGGQIVVFNSGSVFVERKTDAKTGKVVSTPLVETIISLVDGSSSPGLVFINDPEKLKENTALWNNWLATTNLESYSMPLAGLGTEQGISVLTSVSMTRHWINQPGPSKAAHKLTVDTRVEKIKRFSNTQYSTRLGIADTSQSIMLSAPYETVLNTWILPINFSGSGSTQSDQSLVQRWQAIMAEPYLATTSSGNTGQSLAENHATYAAKMTKSKLSGPNDWTKFFDQMAVEGRGGVLSGLVASLIGSAFGPTAGSVAGAVSSMLPI